MDNARYGILNIPKNLQGKVFVMEVIIIDAAQEVNISEISRKHMYVLLRSVQQVVDTLAIANNDLPAIEVRFKTLRNDVSMLLSQKHTYKRNL
jgi:hypothetical protein